MRNREPRGFAAAAFAPALFRSSPTTNRTPKFRVPAASNFSAATIIEAMMPFASQDPRPQMNSLSSREAKNGGTVSMCVESVMIGSPQQAKTLSRLGSTGMRSIWPLCRAAMADKCARQFEQIHCHLSFLEEQNERKEPRGKYSGRYLSIALHPDGTDDSGQALDPSPNRSGFSYRCDFGGQQQTGPFCAGVRSCSKKLARLLMASAPLPRKIKFTGTSR